MRYIKFFEEYKIPEKVYRSDTTLLNEDTFTKLLNENCSDYIKYITNKNSKNSVENSSAPEDFGGFGPYFHEDFYCLARLVPNLDLDDLYLIDPTAHERKSVDGIPNVYTLIIDNDKKWKQYPKRKNSICTYYQNFFPFQDYFVVIPFNGAKFGVTPAFDIWNHWDRKLFHQFDTHLTATDFLFYIDQFAKTEFGEYLESSDYNKLKIQIEKIDEIIKKLNIDEPLDPEQVPGRYSLSYAEIVVRNILKSENLWDFFTNKLFTPEKFKHVDIKGLSEVIQMQGQEDQLEVWTDSKCLLVGADYYHKFINKNTMKI